MSAPRATKHRPYREVPNSQVLDAAEQFHAAFRSLIAASPDGGVLLPALHCASIALELYLKSLSARELELPDPVLPDVATIHAEARTPSHKLTNLFDLVPSAEQQLLELAKQSRPRLNDYADIRDLFGVHESMFIASRYPFEVGRDFDDIKTDVLGELLDVLDVTIRASHRVVLDP